MYLISKLYINMQANTEFSYLNVTGSKEALLFNTAWSLKNNQENKTKV